MDPEDISERAQTLADEAERLSEAAEGLASDATRMVIGIALAVLTSFSVVGLPSQFSLFNTTVPISLGMGVPMELLPLIVAVEVVPDIFRTVGNVTADMAVTTVVARKSDSPDGLEPVAS